MTRPRTTLSDYDRRKSLPKFMAELVRDGLGQNQRRKANEQRRERR